MTCEKKHLHTKQVSHSRMILCVGVSENETPTLNFTVEVETNELIPESDYSNRQLMVYKIIRYLHQEVGLGYRKISTFMNSSGIKTDRGKEWKNTHVYSVLKRFRQREERINNQRKKKFPNTIGTMTLKPLRTQSE